MVTQADWKEKLTDAQKKHLKENGALSLDCFKADREWQKSTGARCIECEVIAVKLGLEQ